MYKYPCASRSKHVMYKYPCASRSKHVMYKYPCASRSKHVMYKYPCASRSKHVMYKYPCASWSKHVMYKDPCASRSKHVMYKYPCASRSECCVRRSSRIRRKWTPWPLSGTLRGRYGPIVTLMLCHVFVECLRFTLAQRFLPWKFNHVGKKKWRVYHL